MTSFTWLLTVHILWDQIRIVSLFVSMSSVHSSGSKSGEAGDVKACAKITHR
jgi:hypothetical protein